MDNCFIRVAAATPLVKVADCQYNGEQILRMIREASAKGVQVIAFPELAITAYTCLDLFAQPLLTEKAENTLFHLVEQLKELDILTFIGLPLRLNDLLINACVAFQKGRILGVVPKTYLPNYKEFQEKRWFTSSHDISETTIPLRGTNYPLDNSLIFTCGEIKIGIEICEDLWMPAPPSSYLAMRGANLFINPSASNELTGKHLYRKELVSQQSARCNAGYIYAACGYGESTTDLVFAGSSLIAENGAILAEAPRFSTQGEIIISDIDIDNLRHDRLTNVSFREGLKEYKERSIQYIPFDLPSRGNKGKLIRTIDPHPFIPSGNALDERCEEICSIQIAGLAKRIEHIHCSTAVIGISGGLDSTLALLVTAMTFDLLKIPRTQIVGVTMPGFGTTDRTYTNAIQLMKSLGITSREISIREATLLHFKEIGHDPENHDVTYENAQARERTQLLMDIANQENGIVIGTGDLSELALGWATYNGDHMSMYGVNASIPKTLVKYLVTWIAEQKMDKESQATLLDIADTPISPELIPADSDGTIRQKTEDLVGPYELHDFFLYHLLRFGSRPAKIYRLASQAFEGVYAGEVIKKWLYTFFRRFFQQQFKRSCLPDGPKVGSVSLSPRGDWRMPSDASATLWLKEIEELPVRP